MANQIKSEFYRVFHTKPVYVLTGVCLLVVLSFNGILWAMSHTEGFQWNSTKFAFSMLEGDMHIPLFLSAVMGSLVVTDELKNKTINNAIAFGISREQAFLSKIIVGMAASAFCLAVTEAGLIGSGYLLLENSGSVYTLSLLKGTVACIPAWAAGMTAMISLYFLTGSRSTGIWIWILMIVAAPMVIELLGMKFEFCARLQSWLLYPLLSFVTTGDDWFVYSWSTTAGFLKCQEAGIIGMAVFTVAGVLAVRRKEV